MKNRQMKNEIAVKKINAAIMALYKVKRWLTITEYLTETLDGLIIAMIAVLNTTIGTIQLDK